jgi:hypothetical protein
MHFAGTDGYVVIILALAALFIALITTLMFSTTKIYTIITFITRSILSSESLTKTLSKSTVIASLPVPQHFLHNMLAYCPSKIINKIK